MHIKRISVFLLMFFHVCAVAQNSKKLDSLLTVLKQSTIDDTSKIKLLSDIGYQYIDIDYKKGVDYCTIAIELSQKLKYKAGLAKAYSTIGVLYRVNNDVRISLEYHKKAFQLYIELNNIRGIAEEHNNLGNCHDVVNDYNKALQHFNKAIEIQQKLGNKRALAAIYNNIGNIHKNKGDYSIALEYQFKSLKIKEEIGDENFIAGSYNNIGVTYRRLKNYAEAKKYFSKSLEIKERLKDQRGIAQALTNIAVVIVEENGTTENLKLALSYFSKAAAIRKKMKDITSLSQSMENIANIFLRLGIIDSATYYGEEGLKYRVLSGDEDGQARAHCNLFGIYLKANPQKALQNINEALKIGKKSNSKPILEEVYGLYVDYYTKIGDYKKALQFSIEHKNINDSIYSIESTRQLAEMATKYETEKKEKENDLLKTESKLKDAELEKQATYNKFLYGVIGLTLIVIAVAVIAYINKQRDNKRLRMQKAQIEEQKKEIVDSIHYAKRIQTSLLPTEKYIERKLTEHKNRS